MKIQINLLQDLLQFTNEQWIETQNIHEYSADIPKHHLFALVLYHRWLIKICFNQFPLKTYQKYVGGKLLLSKDLALCLQWNNSKM